MDSGTPCPMYRGEFEGCKGMSWGVMYEMFKSSKSTLKISLEGLGFGEAGKTKVGRPGKEVGLIG